MKKSFFKNKIENSINSVVKLDFPLTLLEEPSQKTYAKCTNVRNTKHIAHHLNKSQLKKYSKLLYYNFKCTILF